VDRPYCVVVPNSTVTCVSAGSVIVQRATSGCVVGWTEPEKLSGCGSDAMVAPSKEILRRLRRLRMTGETADYDAAGS
jgi:hypothetical protein